MSSRFRWKPFVALAVVLIVGVMGARFLIRASHERKEFVSRPDVFSGYRCRFTVSTVWECHSEPHYGYYDEERWTFTLPRSPIRQWIDSHLLHKAPHGPHTITIECGEIGGMRAVMDVNGLKYIEPMVYLPEQVEKVRYFPIDNCAATLATTKTGSAHATKLIVKAPEWSLEFWLAGSTEDVSFPETDQEVQAIIASLHFEKVMGGKQGVRP